MATTAGSIKKLLPSLTTFELADLLDAVHEELVDREVDVDIVRDIPGTQFGEQGVIDWDEYERMWGEDEEG